MERQQFVVEIHDASYNTTLFKHCLLEKILHFMHSTYFQLKQKPECHFLNFFVLKILVYDLHSAMQTQIHETLIQTWQYEEAQMEENPL